MKKKILATVLAAALCIGIGIGGTLAWLADETEDVVNTFTVGNININLTETDNGVDKDGNENTNDYKMVPGNTIAKDPKVTVKANSEASWLFVKIEKSANFDDYMEDYVVADDWTELEDDKDNNELTTVYYREVAATTADTNFIVLKDNQVKVLSTVSKSMMDDIEKGEVAEPTLTFTAYAVQMDNITTVGEAWTQAQNADNY